MASLESMIMSSLQSKLQELSWPKVVEYEKIKLLSSDFRASELPAIQFYDSGRGFKHSQGRIEVEWGITIEIVMKRTSSDAVDQGLLLDRSEEVERKIGENVELGLASNAPIIGNVVHVKYLNAITDLHTVDPYFISLLNFSVNYFKPYTGIC
jgi:hypothetical protein